MATICHYWIYWIYWPQKPHPQAPTARVPGSSAAAPAAAPSSRRTSCEALPGAGTSRAVPVPGMADGTLMGKCWLVIVLEMGGNGGDLHNFTIEAQSRFNTPKERERIGRWFAIKRYVFKKRVLRLTQCLQQKWGGDLSGVRRCRDGQLILHDFGCSSGPQAATQELGSTDASSVNHWAV